ENEVWKACFVSEQPPLERVRPAPLVAELPVQAHRKVDGHAERGRAPLDLHLGARLHVPARSADPAHVPTARARGSRIGGIDAGVELVLALDGRLIDPILAAVAKANTCPARERVLDELPRWTVGAVGLPLRPGRRGPEGGRSRAPLERYRRQDE